MYIPLPNKPKIVFAGCALIGLALSNCSGEAGAAASKTDNTVRDIKPGMDLRKVQLKGADLHGKNMARVNLDKVDLRGADLRGANLYKANLMEADLTGAVLGGVNLYQADLRGAKLSGADLKGADLKGADLFKADLIGSKCDDNTSLPPAHKCTNSQVVVID